MTRFAVKYRIGDAPRVVTFRTRETAEAYVRELDGRRGLGSVRLVEEQP